MGPQFSGGVTVIDSNSFSTYNGLVMQYRQHFKAGITFQVSYTYSKALATGDFDPTFTVYSTANSQGASSTPFDLYNRKLNYGEPQYDRGHAVQGHGTFELPFGPGGSVSAIRCPALSTGSWAAGRWPRFSPNAARETAAQVMAKELASDRIRVNCVAPAWTTWRGRPWMRQAATKSSAASRWAASGCRRMSPARRYI